MTVSRSSLSRLSHLAIAAPLALVLASCGSEAEGGTGDLTSDPIADIAAPEGTSWAETATISDQSGYVTGNPDAPIKLVEYASHTCGACANFSTTAKPELKPYIDSGVVSFEHRQLIRNSFDLVIATMVQCGAKESMQPLSDQAWASFNEVMAGIQANPEAMNATGELPPSERFVKIAEIAGLTDFFAARGLSADQANACLADIDTIQKIADASDTQAKELNVQATPTFFLNDAKLDENSWDKIEPLLQRAGARDE